jgi:hypothetical protein
METLSAPVTAHNLTGWFILTPAPAPDHDYSVLEEAIDSQTTLLHETGAVNELLIENTGDIDLFIQAGDIVKGGKQDRTIGSDFIVPARSGRIPLPAYCVEQSRWRRRSSEPVTHFSASKEFLSSKKARIALQLLKSQGEVWKRVAEEQQSLASAVDGDVCSAESPSSLQLTYENETVRHAVADYTTPLEGAAAAAGGSVVGVVWAINGVPSHADRYVNPRLFAKVWRKLLRAAAIEALGQSRRRTQTEGEAPSEPPSAASITEWLAARELRESSRLDEEQLPPRTRVRTHSGRSLHRFEVFDTALDAATPLHVTVLAD